MTAEIVSRCEQLNLIVFGGDTLHSVLKQLGCDGVIPISEIVPGVIVSGPCAERKICRLITKSGGFGNEDVLRAIDEYIF